MIFFIPIFLTSCTKESANSFERFNLTDDVGNGIGFDTLPSRIISLAPNITEALYAIGAGSSVVGITDFCDYPPEATAKTKTGSYLSPNYELMMSLRPDLIIMNVESTSQPTYHSLKNLKMKIFVSNARNIDGILKMLNDLGRITGRENSAKEIIDQIIKERNKYSTMSSGNEGKKCLVLISVNPLMTASGKTFISEIAELSGFQNIYKNEQIDYPLVSYEDANIKNPAYIILPTDTADAFNFTKYVDEISNKLSSVDAVKNGKIILIDDDIMYRPGPRVIKGIDLLNQKLRTNN